MWSDAQILEANASVWNFDLAPDGKRVVASPGSEAGGQKRLVHVPVLLNFFDELRRKMLAGNNGSGGGRKHYFRRAEVRRLGTTQIRAN